MQRKGGRAAFRRRIWLKNDNDNKKKIISCPFLSYSVLICPVLSYPVISCPVLFYEVADIPFKRFI